MVSPSLLATSASVVERAPLVLKSFAARDRIAARLARCCVPRLKGELALEFLLGDVCSERTIYSNWTVDWAERFSPFENLNFKYFF